MNKEQYIKRKEAQGSTPKYTCNIQKRAKRNPWLWPNQSTKSTTEGGPKLKNPLVYAHRLQRKNNLHPWIECSSFSNVLFLSFQTIPKRHKGAENHTFFLSFPTQGWSQPNNISLTEEGSTHETPKREKSKLHKLLASTQCKRMWSIDSSSNKHK